MSGYCYGEPEPIEPCPYCSTPCRADFVDVSVGMVQCGPYHCEACGASEMGPNDEPTTADERKHGWFAPGAPPSQDANVVDGKIVSYREAKVVYEALYPFSATDAGRAYIRGDVEP